MQVDGVSRNWAGEEGMGMGVGDIVFMFIWFDLVTVQLSVAYLGIRLFLYLVLNCLELLFLISMGMEFQILTPENFTLF